MACEILVIQSVSYIEASYIQFGNTSVAIIRSDPKTAIRKKDACLFKMSGREEIREETKLIMNQGAMISEYSPASLHSSPNTNTNSSDPKKKTIVNGIMENRKRVFTD